MYCKNNDIEFITTNVGDKYVLEYLRDNNLSLGGEEAGHIILKEYCNTGDGPLTSLIMLSILASTNTTFSNLTKIMHKYPEVHINIKVNNKKGKQIGSPDAFLFYLSLFAVTTTSI